LFTRVYQNGLYTMSLCTRKSNTAKAQ